MAPNQPEGSDPDLPWIVVGLGNPGASYARNRHNVGHLAIDELLAQVSGRLSSHRSRALVWEGRLSPSQGRPGPRLVLAKPTCYMNESGSQVGPLMKFYSAPSDRLLVLHDEMDVDFGLVRVKFGGGEAGHNGLRSITSSLGTRDYARLRLGVGRPPGRMPAVDFVLRDFPAAQREDVALMLGDAADAVERVVRLGVEQARNVINAPR